MDYAHTSTCDAGTSAPGASRLENDAEFSIYPRWKPRMHMRMAALALMLGVPRTLRPLSLFARLGIKGFHPVM